MEDLLYKAYGHVFEEELLQEIAHLAKQVAYKEGDVLIDYGQYIKSMPLLLSGAVKVMREDYDSGELLLYYLEKGDTCAMSMSCCMGEKQSEIRAIGEVPGILLMIPIQKMSEWIGKYKSWMVFVFESYNNRFNELLNAVDTIAFLDMKGRLLNYLFEKSKIDNSRVVNKTHQDIAKELNTSRVVVSRLLKALETEGRIKLNRNSVDILIK
ncbi:Crp/Fnr family transcriptional regulator [Sphingobacterium rhinopitheci]|uniref:Crp/Fnr family transcriptional regulator n=1 Tax=Sphingobacterium rhinopitheci TaxID=2781960 RepID=UPI001F518909|nr:Crp/Fnr family transcriptional regulator [Sphingobacterium rhinopitheci]MCI0919848.1 Crp/Fnr family transcriptional regulator [Sphingobacterium rhinopitheci]